MILPLVLRQYRPTIERRACLLRWSLFWLVALSMPAAAQTVSVEIYNGRLRQIQESIGELAKNDRDGETEGLMVRLAQLRATIPTTEEIASEGVRLQIDNHWLIDEIDSILQVDPRSKEGQARLSDLEFRIGRLRLLMLSSSSRPPVPDYRQERELLSSILSGPEYRPEEVRESSVRRWLRLLKDSLISLFRRLLPGSVKRDPQEIANQLSALQKVVLFISIPLAIFLLYRLIAGYRWRRYARPAPESQEILGELIAPDLTPKTLLERAGQLAQTEEYRQAIRLSFIASILQMAQHGIVTVHPTRTNRDYLKALPSGSEILPIFSILTSLFEDFWYGERTASAEDYEHFDHLVALLGREMRGESSAPQLNEIN